MSPEYMAVVEGCEGVLSCDETRVDGCQLREMSLVCEATEERDLMMGVRRMWADGVPREGKEKKDNGAHTPLGPPNHHRLPFWKTTKSNCFYFFVSCFYWKSWGS